VVVKPSKITAEFMIRAACSGSLRGVVITAANKGDIKQVKFESGIDPVICSTLVIRPTVVYP